MKGALILAALLAASSASADDESQQQVVVVNATTNLSTSGPIARLHRVLDSRKLLVQLDDMLEATLDGRSALIADLDAIRDAYASSDLDTALALIDMNERRVLDDPISRDPLPLLAELSQWRGRVAAVGDSPDEAVRWFRAAYRFNPAWVMDDRLASPRVRSLVKRAKREPEETGALRLRCDTDDSQVSIDGGEPRRLRDRMTLAVGTHLVIVTARKRKAHAELVVITDERATRLDISLEPESTIDRAARLVDATTSAPAGKPRLDRANALAKLTGAERLLVIEDGTAGKLTVRLYDVAAKKVSKPLELDGKASSQAIARDITSVIEQPSLMALESLTVRSKPWYSRWYVWAAAGAVAATASYGAYAYATSEPAMLRGL